MNVVILKPIFFNRVCNHRFYNLRPYYLKYTNVFISIFISALFMLANPVSAQASEALKMKLTACKVVVNQEGETTYIPVSKAKIGTVIQYKARYSNVLDTAIQNTIVTLPIPTNTEFTGEAYPPSAQASIDYYNYRDLPLMRMVDGQLTEVPLSEYKSLRWEIKYIPPHKSVDVAFNTIVH